MRFLQGFFGFLFLGYAYLHATAERYEHRIWEDMGGTMPYIEPVPLSDYTVGEWIEWVMVLLLFCALGSFLLWRALRRRRTREPVGVEVTI